MSGTRVFLLDQILGRGREIIEHVLFVRQIAGLVPFLAELAAAADVGDDIDPAAIEPEPPGKIERRRHADAVTAVAISSVGLFPSSFVPLRRMMLSGTLVPSFEGANSRVTSISENETGEVLTSAVFTGSICRRRTSNQAAGSV